MLPAFTKIRYWLSFAHIGKKNIQFICRDYITLHENKEEVGGNYKNDKINTLHKLISTELLINNSHQL